MFKLDEFFRVSQEVTLPDGEVVTCRVLSDIEMNARSTYALSKSVEMTTRLRDTEREEYKVRIKPLGDAPTPQLIDTLIAAQRMTWAREANELFPVKFFPYPDEATDEERVKAELAQKEHETENIRHKLQYVADAEKKLRAYYEGLERELLSKTAMERAIQLYAMDASNMGMQHFTIWRAYERDGKPYWASPEVVSQMGDRVIATLFSKYTEVDSQDPWELTKSQPAGSAGGLGTNGKGRRRRR